MDEAAFLQCVEVLIITRGEQGSTILTRRAVLGCARGAHDAADRSDRGGGCLSGGLDSRAGAGPAVGDDRADGGAGGHVRAGESRAAESSIHARGIYAAFSDAVWKRRAERAVAMQVVALRQPDHIRPWLRADRFFADYALGDLDPAHFQFTEWFGAERTANFAPS